MSTAWMCQELRKEAQGPCPAGAQPVPPRAGDGPHLRLMHLQPLAALGEGTVARQGGWCSQQLWLGTPPALPERMQALRRAAALHSPPGAHLAPGRLLPSSGAPRDRAQHRGCQAGRSLQLLWPGRQSPVSPAG